MDLLTLHFKSACFQKIVCYELDCVVGPDKGGGGFDTSRLHCKPLKNSKFYQNFQF